MLSTYTRIYKPFRMLLYQNLILNALLFKSGRTNSIPIFNPTTNSNKRLLPNLILLIKLFKILLTVNWEFILYCSPLLFQAILLQHVLLALLDFINLSPRTFLSSKRIKRNQAFWWFFKRSRDFLGCNFTGLYKSMSEQPSLPLL